MSLLSEDKFNIKICNILLIFSIIYVYKKMLESPTHLRKRKYSTCIKKTKEEQERDLAGLPRHIGPYELIEKLRDGGYSKIYKAKSNYTGDFVAIKSIEKLCFQESAEDVLLMVRQAEVLKILKHRNLVNLYEIYESQKFFYMIMDYIPNGDLIEQIIKKKRFPEQEALVIFSQLVDALYYMHKNEICHRDIRTEKILFDKKNQPKLVGFSYSSFYTKGKKIRDNYGSLCYACPEIIQNDYYNPELADVWSLGVVLYVMVCGYLPFSEDDDDENKYLIINGKVDYPPQISNKVKDLLKHMLDIDPNKRYTFQKILRHPWFKPFDESSLTGGCNPYKMIYPVDERILKLIVIYGFNKKEVDKDLKQNTFNCRTGLYKQLSDKLLYMGFTSLSDLCSDDFMKFSRDQENIISDGEAKYKKYINKILERIKKVERYVNDYKRKEDKIIKDLENIYSDAVNEENKINKKGKSDNISKDKQYKNLKTQNYNNRINNNNKEQISKTKRKTVSPYEMIKEQKVINKIYKNEIKNKVENNDEDFDVLKEFHKQNKVKENTNNKNSTFLSLEESDFDINNYKIKRTKSDPDIKDFVQKLIEKDDKARDSYELDSQIYEENLNVIRNSKRKRQLSVMIKRKKRNYLNAGSENDYFLKRPKDNAERKKIIENNYKKSIKNIIIEENINEEKDREEQNKDPDEDDNLGLNFVNDKKEMEMEENNNKKGKKVGENKRKKSLRFSLSFGDDDEDEEEDENYNDNSEISQIESKRVSMYDIDEEIKELKEIKNTIKSPLRSSFLKRNTNDNNLINFNMESNSSIFGEHLEEDVHRKNSNAAFLETVNEKYDLLTELKRLSDNANRKKKNLKNEGKNKINENDGNKEFIYDSFGESKNENEKEKEYSNFYKEENKDNSINYKNNNNLIVFDDKLEISFHDEKSDINTESQKEINFVNTNSKFNSDTNKKNKVGFNKYMIYSNDKKKISKLNPVSQLEDNLFNIQNINSRRQKQFNLKFKKDIFVVKKLNIINNSMTIIDIISKMSRLNNIEDKNQKNELYNYLKKENKKKYNNKEKYKYKSETKNNKKSNHNKSLLINNDVNRDNICNINYLLNDKNNNIINFYNQNDNYNQKIYIFDNSQNIQNTTTNEIKSIKNNIRNNIVINQNNNTFNNLQIKNKNNYKNYYESNASFISKEKNELKRNKINYTIFEDNLSKSKISLKLSKENKNSKIDTNLKNENKLTNTFKPNKKMELYLLYSEKLKTTKTKNKSQSKSNETTLTNKTYKSNKFNFSSSMDKKNIKNNDNILEIQKNLNERFKNMSINYNPKKHKGSISIEKAFHYSLINDEKEELEDKERFISKIKKGRKLKKLLSNEKTKDEKNNKFYKKFVNKNTSYAANKTKSNYSEIYLKKLNTNKNA